MIFSPEYSEYFLSIDTLVSIFQEPKKGGGEGKEKKKEGEWFTVS